MILHMDLDTFFVSAHRTLDLSLLNKPVAVGGRSNLKIFEKEKVGIQLYNANNGAFVNPVFFHPKTPGFKNFFVDHQPDGSEKVRGIIVTSSYEARAKGVKTGMPLAQALQLCPDMEILVPNYLLYHELSFALHHFLKQEIPKVEQFSIDEFFGDLDGWVQDEEVFAYAQRLKRLIWEKFRLPISIGVSSSKWIAKLATKFAKPNGVYMVKQSEIPSFIENLPIETFPGIGKGYRQRLQKHFITTLGEASRRKDLFYSWKKPGIQLYHRIVGDDGEGISPLREKKSVGISRTFDPICDKTEVLRRVMILARHLSFLIFKEGQNPTSYYLSMKSDRGLRIKKRVTVDRLFSERLCKETFQQMFYDALKDVDAGCIEKISMNLSNFSYQKRIPLSLLNIQEDQTARQLSKALQTLRQKYSLDIVKNGNEL